MCHFHVFYVIKTEFERKEIRGKLAIAVTANFINCRTKAEAGVEEISGVAKVFNQKLFKDLNRHAGIDLENIVYYKDETHCFVMTAKKHSLLRKGVLLQVTGFYNRIHRLTSGLLFDSFSFLGVLVFLSFE